MLCALKSYQMIRVKDETSGCCPSAGALLGYHCDAVAFSIDCV